MAEIYDNYIEQQFIECGFFNAVEENGNFDREYFAEDFCKPYHRIISDGIFPVDKDMPNKDQPDFKVVYANQGRNITLRAGEGIFDGKWFRLKTPQTITVPPNDQSAWIRKDSIVIRIDNRVTTPPTYDPNITAASKRCGHIIYRVGIPSIQPEEPALINQDGVKEWRIANIIVGPNVGTLSNADIEDRRGIDTPFVASIIKNLNTQQLFTQWNALFNAFFSTTKQNIDDWIEQLTEQLSVETSFQFLQQNYTTVGTTASIPINITAFDPEHDILLVTVNNYLLTKTVDYTVSYDATHGYYVCNFTNNITVNAHVMFYCVKSVVTGEPTSLIAEVNALDNKVNEFIHDLGWQNVTLESGTAARTVQIRQIGKIVYLRGVVTGITSSGTVIAHLPVASSSTPNYCPDQTVYITHKFSTNNGPVANITIDQYGAITIASVSATPSSDMQLALDGSWLTVDVNQP